MGNPAGRMGEEIRDRLVWPDVIAATIMGDDGRYFATVSTNNNDTVARVYVYWHTPDDDPSHPVLMIEIDDDPVESTDINVRIRRNDGLVAQGTPDEMQYLREEERG